MNVAETNQLDRIRELVNEARGHFDSAVDAHDKVDDKALAAAHRRLGVSFRSIDKAFQAMATKAVVDDIHASQKSQTSAGITAGTGSSSKPRAAAVSAAPVRQTPGLLTNDPAEFLRRARLGSR
jgi:hypothetical protein